MSSSGAPLPSSFDGDVDFYSESRWQKFSRKLRQEPLVPIGCMLTVFALVGASRAMRSNDHARANVMFRRRIYAQAFTIAAIVIGGSYYKNEREQRKEFDEIEKERLRIEKREKWLAELEARDLEDRRLGEIMGERRREHMGVESSINLRKKEREVKEGEEEGPKRGRKGGAIVGSVKDLVDSKK